MLVCSLMGQQEELCQRYSMHRWGPLPLSVWILFLFMVCYVLCECHAIFFSVGPADVVKALLVASPCICSAANSACSRLMYLVPYTVVCDTPQLVLMKRQPNYDTACCLSCMMRHDLVPDVWLA